MEIPGLAEKLVEYLDSENEHRTNHTVKNINEINMGWETELFTFESNFQEGDAKGHEDLVLRVFSGDNAATKSSKEFYLMKRLDETGYPVPPVYYLETSGGVIGKPFLIMKRIMGKTLDASFQNETEEGFRDGISRLMSLLADLHSLDTSVFMEVPYLPAFQSIQDIIDYYEKPNIIITPLFNSTFMKKSGFPYLIELYSPDNIELYKDIEVYSSFF